MANKIIKLATIRDNANHVCPYGLHIPTACNRAGKTVQEMVAVVRVDDDGFDTILFKDKNELSEVIKSNLQVLMWSDAKPELCMYADKLFDTKPKVECNYGDQAAGIGHAEFSSSPAYVQYFSAGYSSVPSGYYGVGSSAVGQNGSFESALPNSFSTDESVQEKIKK